MRISLLLSALDCGCNVASGSKFPLPLFPGHDNSDLSELNKPLPPSDAFFRVCHPSKGKGN